MDWGAFGGRGYWRGSTMHIRFYRDPDTGEPHICDHGVTEAEVSQVLRRAGEDLPAADGASNGVGADGRRKIPPGHLRS